MLFHFILPEADSPGLEAVPVIHLKFIMLGLGLPPGLQRSRHSRFGGFLHHQLAGVACLQLSQLCLVLSHNPGQGSRLLTEHRKQ